MVYARGKQPRVRQHYEYRWFWSDWMIAHTPIKGWIKMIGPLTDHEVQSMNISTLFNTYKTSLIMNYIGQASIFQLSKLLFSLTNKLRGIQHRFLEKGWFIRKPTWSRAQHNSQVTNWWYFREDIRKITNHRYVTKLGSNLAFQGKTIWSQEWGIGTILTHWSRSAPGNKD